MRQHDCLAACCPRPPIEAAENLDLGEAGARQEMLQLEAIEPPQSPPRRRTARAPSTRSETGPSSPAARDRGLSRPSAVSPDPRRETWRRDVRASASGGARQLRIEHVKGERAARSRWRRTAASAASCVSTSSRCEKARKGQVTSRKRRSGRSSLSMRVSTSSRFLGTAFFLKTASIAGDASTPTQVIPSRAMGKSVRPVPQPSSSTGPPDARASSR